VVGGAGGGGRGATGGGGADGGSGLDTTVLVGDGISLYSSFGGRDFPDPPAGTDNTVDGSSRAET
jgi:hypothetical protein